MKYSIDKQEHYTLFTVGEAKLNSLVAPELKTELVLLNNEGHKNIILDLQEVDFVDSSGLSAILVGHRMSQSKGGNFILTGLNENVQKLITISRLENVLTAIPSVQESRDYVMMQVLQDEITREDD